MFRHYSLGLFCALGFLIPNKIFSQALVPGPSDPSQAELVSTDVENFIELWKELGPESDTLEMIQSLYLDRGSKGLKIFDEKYGLDPKRISKAMKSHPEDYNALEKKLAWLRTQEDSIRQYFKKLKVFIPEATFPPTYYIVDRRRGIGSGSLEGQLITIEKEAFRIRDKGLKTHILHELIHLNQLNQIGSYETYLAIYRDQKSLLAISLREGIAEFYAELVTGKYTQEQARAYALANQEELWERFQSEMYGKETGDWMWKEPQDPQQPRDLGYVFGALLAEYFYKTSPDLNQANQTLLSLTDYDSFIKKLDFDRKFKGKE